MKCKNCGKEVLSDNNSFSSYEQNYISKREKEIKIKYLLLAIISIIIAITSLVSTGIFSFINKITKNYETMEYIIFEKDEIPTFSKVVGIKEINDFSVKTSEESSYISISYDIDRLTVEDIDKYSFYLERNGFKSLNKDSEYLFRYIKQSKEDGYVIIVSSIRNYENYDKQIIVFEYEKIKKDISNYEYEK